MFPDDGVCVWRWECEGCGAHSQPCGFRLGE